MSNENLVDINTERVVTDIHESLLSNINHALRTPLNGLVGMSELLAKSGLSDKQLKYADTIRESTELLIIQLNNIMEMAKIDADEVQIVPEPVCIRDLVKDALKPLITIAVKQEIPLFIHFDPELPHVVSIDSYKVQQILTNLVCCALKFAERGKVVLNVHYFQNDDDKSQPEQIEFSINNSKMLADAYDNAMAYYRSQQSVDIRNFGEIAISLITVQQLLELMGSKISYEHLENNEPPFSFRLNLDQPIEGDLPSSPYDNLTHTRILIYQKDPLEMNLVTQSLILWGIDYTIITDEEELLGAVDTAIKESRPYDIIVFEDFEVGTKLLELKKKIPHFIINTCTSHLNSALLHEFSALLTPPIYPEELLSTLFSIYDVEHPAAEEATVSSEASKHLVDRSFEKLGATVLIVEDDLVSRIYATELLEGFGCKVTAAENGRQALSMLSHFNDYDIIFMDCMMPHVDGYTATQEIRKNEDKRTPIVALTANTLERDKDKCLAAGMDGYITKPVKEQDLYDAIRKHFQAT